MRNFAAWFALALVLIGPQAYAEPASSESPEFGRVAAEEPGMLVLAQAGAERVVRRMSRVGLTHAQVWGIAAGIVVAAAVADVAGLNGTATLALAAVGGTLGKWLLSEPIAEAALTADEPDGGGLSTLPKPETPRET
jgi:hypothetical protein